MAKVMDGVLDQRRLARRKTAPQGFKADFIAHAVAEHLRRRQIVRRLVATPGVEQNAAQARVAYPPEKPLKRLARRRRAQQFPHAGVAADERFHVAGHIVKTAVAARRMAFLFPFKKAFGADARVVRAVLVGVRLRPPVRTRPRGAAQRRAVPARWRDATDVGHFPPRVARHQERQNAGQREPHIAAAEIPEGRQDGRIRQRRLRDQFVVNKNRRRAASEQVVKPVVNAAQHLQQLQPRAQPAVEHRDLAQIAARVRGRERLPSVGAAVNKQRRSQRDAVVRHLRQVVQQAVERRRQSQLLGFVHEGAALECQQRDRAAVVVRVAGAAAHLDDGARVVAAEERPHNQLAVFGQAHDQFAAAGQPVAVQHRAQFRQHRVAVEAIDPRLAQGSAVAGVVGGMVAGVAGAHRLVQQMRPGLVVDGRQAADQIVNETVAGLVAKKGVKAVLAQRRIHIAPRRVAPERETAGARIRRVVAGAREVRPQIIGPLRQRIRVGDFKVLQTGEPLALVHAAPGKQFAELSGVAAGGGLNPAFAPVLDNGGRLPAARPETGATGSLLRRGGARRPLQDQVIFGLQQAAQSGGLR